MRSRPRRRWRSRTFPTSLLDLIARDPLGNSHFSFLRQIAKNSQAAVADNATKPLSTYTFEEVEDRARVVAHLSEPFPLRYLEDHGSMAAILDGQIRAGVREEVERLIVDGTGTGEAFDLLREDGTGGGFLMDQAAVATIFGPHTRVTSLAVPVGVALLADWSQLRLRVRQEAHTLAATQGDCLFDKNQVKLRAEGRFGFEFRRPKAVAVVNLTA